MANWASVAALGDPSTEEWKRANLKRIEPIKGQSWEVYAPAAEAFEGLLNDLIKLGYSPISSGGYNYRNIRGSDKLSQHAFGTAIDLNALTNAMGQSATDIPDAAELAKKWGLEWGGNWKNPDPMHFEYTGGGGSQGQTLTAQQQWMQGLWQHAQAQSARTGVDPRIIMAQTALETGYGKSAPGNNYFGIKGGGQVNKTLEFINGKMTPVEASFSTYKDPSESFGAYGDLLLTDRYKALREAKGLEAQIAALGASGYATDPDYAKKIQAIAAGIPETGFATRVTHPTTTVGTTTGDPVKEAATPVAATTDKTKPKDKYAAAAMAGMKGLGALPAPKMGAGGNAPQLPAMAPMALDAVPMVAGDVGARRDQLAMLMQKLNAGQLW